MKRTLIWCLLGFVLLVSAAWSQAQKSGGTEQAVAALEQQWLQSQQTNSPDVLAPLLADKLVELEIVDSIGEETVRRTLKKTTSSRG